MHGQSGNRERGASLFWNVGICWGTDARAIATVAAARGVDETFKNVLKAGLPNPGASAHSARVTFQICHFILTSISFASEVAGPCQLKEWRFASHSSTISAAMHPVVKLVSCPWAGDMSASS